MSEKNNVRLALILIVIVAIGVGLFYMSTGSKPIDQTATPPAPVASADATAPAADTSAPTPATDAAPAADAVTPSAAAATDATPAAAPAEAAPVAEAAKPADGSLLAAPTALTIDVAAAMKDRVIGKEDAPVTIIEYASLSCPHCAHFTKDILPEVKKQLIDTGKAKLIFRDFPLDSFALKASEMARCADADKYFGLIEVIFSSQERWTQAKDPLDALAQIGALSGMDTDTFKACTTNTELENAILKGVNDAQSQFKVRSTPTFVFNNGEQTLTGAQDASDFVKIVDKLSGGK